MDQRQDAGGPPDAGIDAGPPERDTGVPPVETDAGGGEMCPAGQMQCAGACVDTQISTAHCGGCGATCAPPRATPLCSLGTCSINTCEAGWLDCDDLAANGCEQRNDCTPGPCDTTCGTRGTRDCTNPCSAECTPPEETCNAADDDCDGNCEIGLPGCRQVVYRAYGGIDHGHLYSPNRTVASTAPYNLEGTDGIYFHTYANPASGLVALQRCRKSNGLFRLSTEAGCGSDTYVETVGFVSATPDRCGSVPLYELFAASSSNHFYAITEAERDFAVDDLGYVLQRIVGYVWTSL